MPFFRRYRRRGFRRPRRFRRRYQRRTFRRFNRRRSFRAVRWSGKWLQGPSCHRTLCYTGNLDQVDNVGTLYTLLSGPANLPLVTSNNIVHYDTERHSQRIKMLSMRYSATIYWPDHAAGVAPANPAQRLRIVFFLGRAGLSDAEVSQWITTPGAPVKSLQYPVEQGCNVGYEYRRVTGMPASFIKHVYFDKIYRRRLEYDQPSRTRFSLNLPVRGLKFQYGMYTDDINWTTNQDVYMFLQADAGPATNLCIGNVVCSYRWKEGKPAVGTVVFLTPPGAEAAALPLTKAIPLIPMQEARPQREVAEEDVEELVSDLTVPDDGTLAVM